VDAWKKYTTVGFIVVVLGLAFVVGTRTTVMRGHVIGAKLLENLQAQDKRIERIECDDEIPIGSSGATFECTVFGGGDSRDIGCEMDRQGLVVATPIMQRRHKP
jgi:hypothetical protein